MKKRFLVTTALVDTWPENEPVLFLGEWCRSYSQRHIWENMDEQVFPYHWDNRDKLYHDYNYLISLYEILLDEMTLHLDKIHDVFHSKRYWRILIGGWLGYFIQVLYDRWFMIDSVSKQCENISGTILLEKYIVFNDSYEFAKKSDAHEWNHHIYSEIIKTYPNLYEGSKTIIKNIALSLFVDNLNQENAVDKVNENMICSFCKYDRDDDAFLISTYLSPQDEDALYLRFGQKPKKWQFVSATKSTYDLKLRDWALEGESHNKFEKFCRQFIPKQIPMVYLEGYDQLCEQTENAPWPKNPRVIMTSNSHYYDDVFKAWAASKVEKGTPLVIGQHGGHYGTAKFSFYEDHDVKICDRYLSWGWTDIEKPHIYPVGQIKSNSQLKYNYKNNNILFVTATFPQYSYYLHSIPISGQYIDYIEEQCSFVNLLSNKCRSRLNIRFYMHDRGWHHKQRWKERFPNLNYDDGKINIDELIKKCRIYVSTYNATTFLESLSMNIPTIIFWNPFYFEIKKSAIPFFNLLSENNIFHSSAISAAKHINNIFDDIEDWWSSYNVKYAKKMFCKRYCFKNNRLAEDIYKICQIHEQLK